MAVDPDHPDELGSAAAPHPVTDAVTRGPLDRHTVISGAITLIDRDGARALTMRRLGVSLGVEAMALYHYVNGRDDLVDGVVEQVIDDLYGDPEVLLTSDSWQDYLQRLAHGVRRIALAHPQVFPLVATRPPAAPWVRPPLRSLRWMESFLDTLNRSGFSDVTAVAAYRGFSSFLLGHLLLEVSLLGADVSPVDESDRTPVVNADLSAYPRLASLQQKLAEDRSAEEFEESLESLLDRLESIQAGSDRPAAATIHRATRQPTTEKEHDL